MQGKSNVADVCLCLGELNKAAEGSILERDLKEEVGLGNGR